MPSAKPWFARARDPNKRRTESRPFAMENRRNDRDSSSDGHDEQIGFKAGAPTKGKADSLGKNNLAKGQTALPIGVVAQLAGNTAPTIQKTACVRRPLTRDNGCSLSPWLFPALATATRCFGYRRHIGLGILHRCRRDNAVAFGTATFAVALTATAVSSLDLGGSLPQAGDRFAGDPRAFLAVTGGGRAFGRSRRNGAAQRTD